MNINRCDVYRWVCVFKKVTGIVSSSINRNKDCSLSQRQVPGFSVFFFSHFID